ncbi:MAG: LacI family DNA-binding transcriptional regulator [Pseudonocardia sp.]
MNGTEPVPRVRLRDVARQAGVAQSTASAVLTGRSAEARIAPATRERVQAAATELGYRPNLAARNLRSRTSRTIGLVSDAIAAEPYAGEMVRGASAAAVTHGRLLLIAESDGSRSVEDDLVHGMIDRQVDGLIYGCLATRRVTLSAAVRSLPTVLLNCLADPLPGPAVVPDDVAGGREAVAGLLTAGHREGIHVVGRRHRNVLAGRRRLRGIRARLAQEGCAVAGLLDCDWTPEDSYAAVSGLLRRTRPAALICLNDRVAFGAYQALAAAGLRVPQDVSVVGFDDSVMAGWMQPGLSSVALPYHEMGRLAADLLIKEDRHPVVHTIGMLLRHRGSIGPPARVHS